MKKKIYVALLVFVLAVSLFGKADNSFADSYTYDINKEDVVSPDAYEWQMSIRGKDLGIDSLDSLADVFYRNDKIFILKNGMIVITDKEFSVLNVITEYEFDGEIRKVDKPKCIYVTEKDDIYITEEAKGEIIQLDISGKCKRIITDPKIETIENITFQPTKVVVDNVGRIYVKAKSVYEGIIELDENGKFVRFVGANMVVPSLIDRTKRMFATKEQIAKMQLWLPTDYSDMTLSNDGYLFVTVKDTTTNEPIRKLNLAGKDAMKVYEYIPMPAGDYAEGGGTLSALTNIAVAEDGRFAVLDASKGRVFVYAPDGILLYVVGGSGRINGKLNSPVDLTFLDDKILVADLVTQSIEVFKTTEYGELVNTAMVYQTAYDYETAAKYWEKVYNINPSLVAANMGLGKYYLRSGEYDKALESFEKTGERESWSAAYEKVREKWLEDNLGKTIIWLIVIIVVIEVLKRFIRKKKEEGLFEGKKWVSVLSKIRYTVVKWPRYMMSSPFKAFDDVKYENAGSLTFSFVILALYAWLALLSARYKGFLMNFNDAENINVPLILASSVCPFLIFVLGNWMVGVLIDGKGNLRNIFKFTMYALYPQLITSVITLLLSRICIYEEVGLIKVISLIGWVLFAFYLFVGLVTVHQFSFSKGLLDVLLTAVAMAIVIFIAVLLASLVTGFVNDIGTIFDEIKIYA